MRVTNEARAPFPGVCRYCQQPRPAGYQITCGRSECQQAAYDDRERRAPKRTQRKGQS